MEDKRSYIAIDLKSFYASEECVERGLDPMEVNLVVADPSRTEKTICLAVSPALKSFGIPGRARLFEVVQRVAEVNALRRGRAPGGKFTGSSCVLKELEANPGLSLDYIVAPPRMAHYMKTSTQIYQIYLNYVAPEDIHVYSIDEVFIDATAYLRLYGCSARELARRMIQAVFQATGITATAGIGTNLYLCKVAMDIVAKHLPADEHGVRIAQLDELSYRQTLWAHRPLTDFWRVGPGISRKLEKVGLFTMGDVARCSMGAPGEFHNEALLFKLFGVNAELLIDHAWGIEPCTIAQIKAYRPESSSMGAGQVLSCPYTAEKARLITREMADALAMELMEKGLVTDQLVLTVGYDRESLNGKIAYQGPIQIDHYGRAVPRHAHGSTNLEGWSASARRIAQAFVALYDRIVDPRLLVRRVNLCAARVIGRGDIPPQEMEQLDLFAAPAAQPQADDSREQRQQEAVLWIRHKYGKNAILKGMNYLEGATARERNRQIGGHRQ